MKRNLLIVLFCALTAFSSCKKSIREGTYLMTVKEYKTNIPLASGRPKEDMKTLKTPAPNIRFISIF